MNPLFSLDDLALNRSLERLAALPWLPETLLEIVGGALRLQRVARHGLSQPDVSHLTLATADAHSQGAPLLPAADYPYDPAVARPLWDELCDLLMAAQDGPAEAVRALRQEGEGHGDLPANAFAAFVRDDAAFFADWATRLPQAPALIRFLAQAALTPQLAAVNDVLAQSVAGEPGTRRIWEHGHCPHCGRPPFMGELRGKEGQRQHVCSFCGAKYRVVRLQCPFCLERGEDNLLMFSTDSLPSFEVHVCKACKCYIKLADVRDQAEALPAALSDLASLPLDMLARQEGYSRPTPSAWGF